MGYLSILNMENADDNKLPSNKRRDEWMGYYVSVRMIKVLLTSFFSSFHLCSMSYFHFSLSMVKCNKIKLKKGGEKPSHQTKIIWKKEPKTNPPDPFSVQYVAKTALMQPARRGRGFDDGFC